MRRQDAIAMAVWGVVIAGQCGVLPGTTYAWGVGLWRYLPTWVGALLAALGIVMCSAGTRQRLRALAATAARTLPPAPRPMLLAAGSVLLVGVCWLCRARHLSGDSPIFLVALAGEWRFVFPDVGATFLMGQALRASRTLLGDPLAGVQLVSCLCAPVAVAALAAVGREITSARSRVPVVALLLAGGMARIFAGHVEAYAPVLASVAVYLWLALRCVRRGTTALAPALALGVGIWIHMAALCLVPSLLVVTLRGHDRLRVTFRALAMTALPMLLFAGAVVTTGDGGDVARTVRRIEQILGRGEPASPHIDRWWIRLPGAATGSGTDFSLLDRGHAKYLGNAFHLLLPWLLPALALLPLRRPRGAGRDGPTAVLTAAAAPLVVYALALRPFWGPYDWDLFAISALVLGTLVIRLWWRRLPAEDFDDLACLATGLAVLAVGLPFLLVGILGGADAGPFAPGSFRLDLRAENPFPPPLRPWL